jgi:hypothetical protein
VSGWTNGGTWIEGGICGLPAASPPASAFGGSATSAPAPGVWVWTLTITWADMSGCEALRMVPAPGDATEIVLAVLPSMTRVVWGPPAREAARPGDSAPPACDPICEARLCASLSRSSLAFSSGAAFVSCSSEWIEKPDRPCRPRRITHRHSGTEKESGLAALAGLALELLGAPLVACSHVCAQGRVKTWLHRAM